LFVRQVLARSVPSQTVWGNVAPARWCNETDRLEAATVAQQMLLGGRPMDLVFGSTTNLSFTACDVEGLPLRHTVPTERDGLPDPRIFFAELRNDTTGDALAVPVDSPAGGRYVAAVTPGRLGAYALHLFLGTSELDRQRATPTLGELLVQVVCPPGLVPDLSTMTCTCDRGYQPRTPTDGGDTGVVANGCEACRPGLFKPELGIDLCQLCAEGTVQPKTASATCDACNPGTFQPERGRVTCSLCPARTNSTAPYIICDFCEAGLYRTSELVLANSQSCQPCPAGTECPYGSTILPALVLQPGTWRISGGARRVELCQPGDGNATACRGGYDTGADGTGYCAPGHRGPVCEVCVEEGRYFNWRTASCTECPSGSFYVLIYSLLLGIPVLLFYLLTLAHRRSPRMQGAFQQAKGVFEGQKLDAKIKIIVGFAQVSSVLGHVYSITLPNLYRVVLQALELVYIDIFGDIFVPSTCMGGFSNFLLLKACLPLALLVVAAIARAGWWFYQQRRIKGLSPDTPRIAGPSPDTPPRLSLALRQCAQATGMAMLPLTLWVATLFCVSASASIFSAFHCRRFVDESDSQQYREFLIESLNIECPTEGYPGSAEFYQLRIIAIVLIGVWPAGVLGSLAIVLLSIRRQIISRRPSQLSRATRMLTRHYKPAFFWWDWVDLLRKLLLTGFVLAVPESVAFLRLVCALLVSVLFLVAQSMLSPFKDYDDQVFSIALQAVVAVLFTGATFMYAYQQFELAVANGLVLIQWQEGRLSPMAHVFAFDSLDQLALVCLVVIGVLALSIVAVAVHVAFAEVNVEMVKLTSTRAPPVLSIRAGHRYHFLLSHIWSAGA